MNIISSIKPVVYLQSLEKTEPNELEITNELADTLLSISEITSKDYGHAVRSVHAKGHGILRGKLIVHENLPAIYQQGLFKYPAEYSVVMRLSTIPGDVMDDAVSTPRGLAIKILEVPGKQCNSDSSEDSQDFLLVNGPAFLNPGVKGFLKSLKLLAATTDKAEGLKKVLSTALRGTEKVLEAFGGKSPIIMSLGGQPETNVLGETYYSQVPILYGKYIAKISLVPVSADLIALTNQPVDLDDKPNGLREAVVDFFKTHSAQWALRVQLCTDIEKMPIEDASVVWPEEESPYYPVATIMVNSQLAWHDKLYEEVEDALSFSPWNAIEQHRPLGSVMRARKLTYEKSAEFRQMFNGCPMHNASLLSMLDNATK